MTLIDRDQACVWHPFTQHKTNALPISIKRGEGAYIFDEKGHRYLDLISSWWVNLHGHAHPDIAKAIYEQACTLEHVIFSNFTHEPAVQLAENLLNLLPTNFSKIFYSDNGSSAVEVALKMAIQYWKNQGQSRKRFIAFDQAYHGDTFGAMSVGKRSGFFHAFDDYLFEVDYFKYPSTWLNDETAFQREQMILTEMSRHLEKFGKDTAAVIIEPLVQGASGMNMCRPQFLRELERLMHQHQVLIIYDEVMTGFGRTGDFFACNKANTIPDIICFAKGLTGGFLPLAATACQQKIFDAFLGDNFATALAHGHSYTANPLGCAAALASLKLLTESKTVLQIKTIEKIHKEILLNLTNDPGVKKPRFCGTIAAFNLNISMEYGSQVSVQLRERFINQGLLIRPLGEVIYLMPPYCITEHELRSAYEIMFEEIEGVKA